MAGHPKKRTIRAAEMRRRSAWILGFLLLMAPAGALAQISFVGTQTVVPGVALEQPYGVVTDAAGNLYVSDPALHEIACYTTANAAYGAPFPITAGLSQPKGMAIDPRGNLKVHRRQHGGFTRDGPCEGQLGIGYN